jgi:flagellar basal-body rod protein FlgG
VIRGVYIAATGMLAETQRQDVIANNLANATTTGYRRSITTATPFAQTLLSNMAAPGAPAIGTLTRGARLDGVTMLDTQGALRATGNPLDLGLVGDGFFAVDTAAGRRYTRDGSFSIDAAGRLVTASGDTLAGVSGPIMLTRGVPVDIAADGTVSQDGAVRGRLLITALAPGSVTSEGANRFAGTATGADGTRVRQGHLEASSVNVVSEMVELIRTMRSFEANQKAAQSHDEALQQSVSRVGRVA